MSDDLRFYFDYISHNAYLAWTQLPRLEREFGIEIEPVPVLFAGLLGAHGQLGPAEVAPKRRWMGRNVMRKAALLGVPLNPPRHHPFNPLLALRASSIDLEPEPKRRLIDGLFAAVWVESRHVSEPAVVSEVATQAGLDGDAVVAACEQSSVKSRLRQQTDRALGAEVFGVPTMIVRDELFFGYDDFPYLEMVLRGEDPLPASEIERWQAADVRPSAMRAEARERLARDKSPG